MIKVGRNVKGESVARDPAGNPDAYGPELLSIDPRAGQPRHARCSNAKIMRRANHHFLEVTHIPVDIASIGLQIENGIPDDLPGPMVRDITATPCVKHVDAPGRQCLWRGQDVRMRACALHTNGNDGRMLEKQEYIVDTPCASFFDELVLQREGLAV
jgi:hypothetical protein